MMGIVYIGGWPCNDIRPGGVWANWRHAMPTTSLSQIFDFITIRRAEVLALVAEGYTQPEIAAKLGVRPTTIKGKIVALENVTEMPTMRNLQRWWRKHQQAWLARIAERTRIPIERLWRPGQ